MAYFPFYIDIENKNILVVGGGTVALRKIEKLSPLSRVLPWYLRKSARKF